MSLLQTPFIMPLLLCILAFHTQQSLTTNLYYSPRPTTDASEQLYSTSRGPEPSTQFTSVTPISKPVRFTTEPFPESSTTPTVQPTIEPIPESSTTPTVQPTTEPVPESSTTPTVQPTTEPFPESSTTPTVQPTTEPFPESSTTPTVQPTIEPIPESSTTPTVQPTTEPIPESSTTPTVQPTTESVLESLTILPAQTFTEPVSELSTAPIVQPTTERISEISGTSTAQPTIEAILGKSSPQPVQHTTGNDLNIIGKPSTSPPVLLPEHSTLETFPFNATVTQTVSKSTSQYIVPLQAKVGNNKTGMLWKTIIIALIMMACIAAIACVLWSISTTSKSKSKSDGEGGVCGGDRDDGGEDGSQEETVKDEFGGPGLMLVTFIPRDSGVGAAGTKEEQRWNEVERLLYIDEDPDQQDEEHLLMCSSGTNTVKKNGGSAICLSATV